MQLLTKFTPAVGVPTEASNWTPTGDMDETGKSYLLPLSDPGVYGLHLRLRPPYRKQIDLFLGQIRVYAPSELTRLIQDTFYENFQFRRVSTRHYLGSRERVQRAKITSIDKLYDHFRSDFSRAAPELRKSFPDADINFLRAAHLLNSTAALWRYDTDDVNEAGCAFIADDESSPASVQDYLAAPNACCSDFTMVLYHMLQKADLDPKIALVPGHNFIEVSIGERTYMFDATVNRIYDGSLDDLSLGQRMMTWQFSSMSSELGSALEGQQGTEFNWAILMRLALGGQEDWQVIDAPDGTFLEPLHNLLTQQG